MRPFLKAIAILLLMMGLTGFCTGSGIDELENVLSDQIGSSNDYWLEKQSAFEPQRWDRVAVVFGMDDKLACASITSALHNSYSETWRCTPAN